MPDATPRTATPSDIPWLVYLALKSYGPRIEDVTSTERWIVQAISNPDIIVLRNDVAAVYAGIQRVFWAPEKPECRGLFLMSEGGVWPILPLLREAHRWAKSRGCVEFHIRSDTEYDLAPLARRLGRSRTFSYTIVGDR